MNQNVGDNDVMIRYMLAVVFIFLGFTVNGWWFVAAVIALATAFFAWCGLYALFGINTCKSKELKEVSIPVTIEKPPAHSAEPETTSADLDKMFTSYEQGKAPKAKPRSRPKTKSKPKKKAKSQPKKPKPKKKK